MIIRNAKKNKGDKSDIYKKIILLIIVLGLLFFLATSGKYLIPQFLKLFKIALPFLTKLIGI